MGKKVLRSQLMNFVCLIFLVIGSQIVLSAKYYIDFSSGKDTYDGLSISSPWKHCPGDQNAEGIPASYTPQPGDKFIFRGGVSYHGKISVISDGITYTGNAWPKGIKAILDGTELFESKRYPCPETECGTNPNWHDIMYMDIPPDMVYTDMIFDSQDKLYIAQDPNLPDPFYEDDFSNYYIVRQGNITRTSITADYFTQTGTDYWDGAKIMVWTNPNGVSTRAVTSYNPGSQTIYFDELHEQAIYGDREQYFSMINHIDLIDRPGEYVVDESTDRMYFWPRDDSPLQKVNYDLAFEITGQDDLVFEGFKIQRYVGGRGIWTKGRYIGNGLESSNLTIRNNELEWIREVGNSHNGGIDLALTSGAHVENNVVNRMQRGSCMMFRDRVTDLIVRNNTVSNCGYKGMWVFGPNRAMIVGNTFTGNFATHGTDLSIFSTKNVLVADNYIYNSGTEVVSFETLENLTIHNNVFLGADENAGIIRLNGRSVRGYLIITNNLALYSGNNLALNMQNSDYGIKYIVKNNIIDGWSAASVEQDTSHNIYTGLSWSQQDKYGWHLMPGEFVEEDLSRIFIDVNLVPGGYGLKGNSPAIDKGTNILSLLPVDAFPDYDFTRDMTGKIRDSNWDLGPFEYGACVPVKEICGNGIDENCDGHDLECECVPIMFSELVAMIEEWKDGSKSLNSVMQAIVEWKKGC